MGAQMAMTISSTAIFEELDGVGVMRRGRDGRLVLVGEKIAGTNKYFEVRKGDEKVEEVGGGRAKRVQLPVKGPKRASWQEAPSLGARVPSANFQIPQAFNLAVEDRTLDLTSVQDIRSRSRPLNCYKSLLKGKIEVG